MQFQDLNLIDPLLRAVQDEGYTTPTPIQEQAIPHALKGKDIIGCAKTGTGKTAAFSLPILQYLKENPVNYRKQRPIRALILSPTRELASQIGDNINAYGRYLKLYHTVVFGGVKQTYQVKALKRGVDILVATPGRLLDLMGQGIIRLDKVEFFVLDEADRMLDMGFINDVRKVVDALPEKRQNLLFSATMPDAIQEFAHSVVNDPVYVEVTPQATTVETIAQSVFFVEKEQKRALLEHLMAEENIERGLIFTRTKHGANRLAEQLDKGGIKAQAIHGNKSQSAREKALRQFKNGQVRVLVATDIASRGIDVDNVTHVINYDLPNEPESYVHRIGRTARAGAFGVAYSFCAADERKLLKDIEKTIRMRVTVQENHPYESTATPEQIKEAISNAKNKQRNRNQSKARSNGNRNNNNNRRSNDNRSKSDGVNTNDNDNRRRKPRRSNNTNTRGGKAANQRGNQRNNQRSD